MRQMNINICSLGLMTLVGLGFISCSGETDNYLLQGEQTVNFTAQVGQPTAGTRMQNNEWQGGEAVGVKVGDETKTYTVKDVLGTMETTDTHPFLWKEDNGNSEVNAWYPMSDQIIDFTDQSDDAKYFACDLLKATATVTSKDVNLKFDHVVTKMHYTVNGWGNYSEADINNAKISFIGYGSATYDDAGIHTTDDPTALITPKKEGNANGFAMMIPCEMWDKPLIRVEIGGDVYVYAPKHTDTDADAKEVGKLKAGYYQHYFIYIVKKELKVTMESVPVVDWDGNTQIGSDQIADAKFKVHIGTGIADLTEYAIQGLENNGNDITDATNGFSITYKETNASGGIAYEGSCTRTRTVADDGKVTFTFTNIMTDVKLNYTNKYMEVGYYFNNDGSFSSAYDAGKAVGIIYQIGANVLDDVTRYAGSNLTDKIRGYVVALADESGAYKWKEGTGDFMSDTYPEKGLCQDANTKNYLGYGNTKDLAGKDDANTGATLPAVATAAAKNNGKTIIGTSGWYLPSYTQVRDLTVLSGKNFANFAGLNGVYWTSTFDSDGGNAFKVNIANDGSFGGDAHYQPVGNESKVRLILTF